MFIVTPFNYRNFESLPLLVKSDKKKIIYSYFLSKKIEKKFAELGFGIAKITDIL